VHDQAAGHPVQSHGQCDGVIQAEAVRTRRRCHADPWPVYHEPMDPARMRRLGPDRVDDHGQRRPGPGLDQPGGLAVGEHELHSGRQPATEAGDHRETGPVVAAELVADADHHHPAAGR